MVKRSRSSNYEVLLAHFELCDFDSAGSGFPRYAAVAEEIFEDERISAKIALRETEEEAFAFLGEAVLDGYQADGVYDLDTAHKIDVYVSVPIVTRADTQGVSANLLAD